MPLQARTQETVSDSDLPTGASACSVVPPPSDEPPPGDPPPWWTDDEGDDECDAALPRWENSP